MEDTYIQITHHVKLCKSRIGFIVHDFPIFFLQASPKGKRASSAKGEKPKSAGRPDSKGKKEEEKPAKGNPASTTPPPYLFVTDGVHL